MTSKAWPDVNDNVRKVMRANKGKDTKPELIVRRLVHGMGYRYRLHRKDLPGKPDLVFGPRKKVIFVHGCFWHAHENCRLSGSPPKTRSDYWKEKLARNAARDCRNEQELIRLGWDVLTIWECGLRDVQQTVSVLRAFLERKA